MSSNSYQFTSIMFILTHQSIESYTSGQITAVEMCLDHKGDVVKQGERYFPLGTDPCTQCTCLNGKPEMCISVFCSPPENCRQYHAVSDKCCEFVCLDGDFIAQNGIRTFNTTYVTRGNGDRNPGTVSTNNLGLRLIASTITSFLILALLLFMIHRLRQRRLLLMIRRLQTRRLEQVNAVPGELIDNSSGMGYFSAHDHYDFGSNFAEPPPPYMWKPHEHYIPPGEAPPPYDDSFGVTISPCFALSDNITTNSSSSPTILQSAQSQMSQMTGTISAPLSLNSPIIDTISSDRCHEHITVVRINANNNASSDSTSSSSVVSSPSNCSLITSSSTSTQSTIRHQQQDSDIISRL